jgi:hypothetical protein
LAVFAFPAFLLREDLGDTLSVEDAFVGVAQSILPAARSVLLLFVARLVVCKELDAPSGEIVDGEFGSRGTVLVDDLIVRAMGGGETAATLADPLLEVVAGDPVVFVECRTFEVAQVPCQLSTSEGLPFASACRAFSRGLNASFQIGTTNFVLEAISSDGSAGSILIAAFKDIRCSESIRHIGRASTARATGNLGAAVVCEFFHFILGGVVTLVIALHEGSVIRTCPRTKQPRCDVMFKRFAFVAPETCRRATVAAVVVCQWLCFHCRCRWRSSSFAASGCVSTVAAGGAAV